MISIKFTLLSLVITAMLCNALATQKCGGHLSDPEGEIKTPNYPQKYDYETECNWTIEAPEGQIVELRFIDFDVEEFDGECDMDKVHVRDGTDETAPVLGKVLCGQAIPETITSSGRYLFLSFSSDFTSHGGRGFDATYVTKPADGRRTCVNNLCGGVIENVQSCSIQSPGYPSAFDGNLTCTWLVKAPNPDDVIALEFLVLHLDSANSQCLKSSVTLRDGPDIRSTIISEPVCDMKFNRLEKRKLVSSGPVVSITFHTTNPQQDGLWGFNSIFEVRNDNQAPSSRKQTSTSAAAVKSWTPSSKRSSTTTTTTTSSKRSSTTTTTTTSSKRSSTTITTTTTTKIPITLSARLAAVKITAGSTTEVTTKSQDENPISNPAVLSGVVIVVIVVAVTVVLCVLLLIAYRHWKKQNTKFTLRLREEDNRSDVNTLISSNDSRDSVEEMKKQNGKKIVRVPETEHLYQL